MIRATCYSMAVLAVVMCATSVASAQRSRARRAAQAQQAPPAEPVPAPEPVPVPVPESAPLPEPEPEPEPEDPASVDLTAIRDEYATLMDDIVQTRARIATLGRQLFQTRVRVRVVNRVGDDYVLENISLRLDGGPIFRGRGSELPTRGSGQVFEGFAAQGPHVLIVEVEQRARAGEVYRYTLRDEFRFEVIRGKTTEVTVTLSDSSGIAEDFPDDEEGEYDVRTRVRVATRANETR